MDLDWIPGVADEEGRMRAGFVYRGEDVKATIYYQLDESGIHFHRVEVESQKSMTATMYRSVNLGEITKEVRKRLRNDPRLGSFGAVLWHSENLVVHSEEERRLLEQQAERAKKAVEFLQTARTQQGRGKLNRETMAAHAELYLSWAKETQDVNKAMLKDLEEREEIFLSMAALRNRTRKCIEQRWLVRKFFNRESGRIEDAVQGQAGAMAGPELIKWRKEKMEEE